MDTTTADAVRTDTPPTGAGGAAWIKRHSVQAPVARLDALTGLDHAKRSIESLAYSLLHAEEVRAAGGSVPRAVLLTGPVGCGKTSLARALAGLVATDAVFLEFVASELTPSNVAAIVRYADAQTRPVVVFVDELSWLGLDRASRRHDPDSRAALYALLSAVSGLREPGDTPVLWLGATSDDPEYLDDALTRAGRFSRVIAVRRPGAPTRRAHLERLLSVRRVAWPVVLDRVVARTAGCTFADLDQIVDDALRLALADGGPTAGIDQRHLDEALVAAGRVDEEPDVSPEDAWRTAIHESGHALAAHAQDRHALSADPQTRGVPQGRQRVSAIVLGRHGGGHTTVGSDPDEAAPRMRTDAEVRAHVVTLLAGAVAERLVFGDASTGCAHDAERAGDLLFERLRSGVDPAWPAAWPPMQDLGPALADRRAAEVTALALELAATAEEILTGHAAGLMRLARRITDEGELTGSALAEALDDAIAAGAR